MNNDDQEGRHVGQGGYYSGRNKIPNIQEFVAQLDREKKDRDAKIDAELKNNKKSNEAHAHHNEDKPSRRDTRTVRDPVTGKDVDIADVKLDYGEAVENPQVSSFSRIPSSHRDTDNGVVFYPQ